MAHGPYGKIFGKVYLRDFQKELLFSPQSFILVKAKKRQCCQSLYSIERECGTWSENNPVETVEHQKEDVPFDMECYQGEEGHVYDFGFGMDYNGTMEDERVRRYGADRIGHTHQQ